MKFIRAGALTGLAIVIQLVTHSLGHFAEEKKRFLIHTGVLATSGNSTVQILCIGTDRSQQTVQTKIRLLKKQTDQGLRCLPFRQHLLDALIQCYIKLFYF